MSRFSLNTTITLLFLALTAVVTYPQVTALGTSVPFHSDPYFSMWRLGWVAHTLLDRRSQLFEANIFFPAHYTLAYSDAMLLPATVLAPLFWLGVSPVLIYNVALFSALTLSGVGMFVLARNLTGSATAAIGAGIVYAFAPYRFDHYMHLELQMVFWLPPALLVIHRIHAHGKLRDGALLGLILSAQALSSLYAAIFFAAYAAIFVALLAVLEPRRLRFSLPPLIVAATATLMIVAPYSLAYVAAKETVGARSLDDVRHYGASLRNYVAAPAINRLYGWTTESFGGNELNLFPGCGAIALALIGLVAASSAARLAYAGALLFAVEMSRGLNGLLYPFFFEFVPPFQALRSPARAAILVNLSIAVLSAYGMAWLLQRVKDSGRRRLTFTAIVVLLTIEYASAPTLTRAPVPSRVDGWLARQPPSVIVQLPLESSSIGSRDWLYMYEGLIHRHRMLNGYSGYVPSSYYSMVEAMRSFPDERSLAFLRGQDVDYVVVRGGLFPESEWSALVERLNAEPELALISMFPDGGRTQMVYSIRR